MWLASAQDELAPLWMTQPLRRAVSKSADEINRELAEDAATKGRELRDGFRVFVVFPIQVLYRIREDDRIVEVLKVKTLQ